MGLYALIDGMFDWALPMGLNGQCNPLVNKEIKKSNLIIFSWGIIFFVIAHIPFMYVLKRFMLTDSGAL